MAEYTIRKQDDLYEVRGLGRLIEHDERSRRYAFDASKVKLASVHHERRVPVLDQGDLGSCTGNAMTGLSRAFSTVRWSTRTCWSIGRSTGGAGRPSSSASSMSEGDTAMLRRNAGENLKLPAEKTSVASICNAARCRATSIGTSGARPEPARSRNVVRPPTYLVA